LPVKCDILSEKKRKENKIKGNNNKYKERALGGLLTPRKGNKMK
jgi:hypothetical protein